MNRRDIDAMRDRLAARSGGEGEDHPVLIVLAGVLFAVAFVLAAFL